MDDELINRVRVEKRSDEPPATHHPDVLPWRLSQSLDKDWQGLGHELHTRRYRTRRLMRECVIPLLAWELGALDSPSLEVERHVVGLATPENGVDRSIELAHSVIARRSRAIEPVDSAIRPRDEAVGADGDIDDDLSCASGHC